MPGKELGMDLVRILAETAGSKKLVGGQMQDLISEGKEPGQENLRYIHENKTAAMIRASLEMGFRIGSMGRDAEKTNGIRRAGTALGLAFQAVDDLLDVTASSEELGKDAAHDSEQGKVTWVTLIGEERARDLASEHTENAKKEIEAVGGNHQFLLELTGFMLERKTEKELSEPNEQVERPELLSRDWRERLSTSRDLGTGFAAQRGEFTQALYEWAMTDRGIFLKEIIKEEEWWNWVRE